ncbi:S-methyl-5-thioribose-1-phosphate isomerase [Frankia sp. CNm7]|uniref:Methylthioribose-1-phosphate isomerase n=1 Tax=Frankia nepalensis TaxID=1836974 RepID=A0A937RLW6_9ACTN|nr:S-methyl-5-thioribose-1-phosphate isomerase [Frankia nepalensis]MBL7511713.1 S-methyl-5-thioribose-1-phosphate isomerase [Frankia nepalensis]MBL7523169.1 S-methyl-5-thioribose-1-phosphate isomerase [Frankia nepalensis]MBL7632527.1 S-methyl-5-thioribose-1-phosphate isomerase [Frankia nepalensis]
MGATPRAVGWTGSAVQLLDQTLLPDQLASVEIHRVDDLVAAIRRLAVRGAPALGIAGAYGVALAIVQAAREGWDGSAFTAAVGRLRAARPTALALAQGVDAAYARVDDGLEAVVAVGHAIADADERANRAIGRHGADWILARLGDRPLRVLTHCNTGALATAAWGTALGIIRELHARGRVELVYVDETRPLLQGSRLTAWELAEAGIDYRVQVDAAAAGTIVGGLVDVAVVGADRIAANGDVANKVGTLGVALACAHAGIPFIVAASASTVDPDLPSGAGIPIERRADDEVLAWSGRLVAPKEARAHNPAFDVTPAGLVSALVTEHGASPPGSPA